MKKFLSLLLSLVLLLALVPCTIAQPDASDAKPLSYEAQFPEAIAIWDEIEALETTQLQKRATQSQTTQTIYALVEADASTKADTLTWHGDMFFWETTDGAACGYSPRLREKIRATTVDANAVVPENEAPITVSYASKGGSPTSTNVALIEPYYGLDSSFTTQYQTEGTSIASATGGTYTLYKTTAATIDVIATALQTCGIVIFDSHGDTDYASGDDYTSQANTSYLCLQSGTGLTTADQTAVTGTYGTYYHAYYAGANGSMKYYCVDGTAISNHMTASSPSGILWMAICLGMATDGMEAPMRAKGVEVVFGYSQSVSFTGDYKYEKYFWTKMKAGATVAVAAAYMKSASGCNWDPAYSSYSQSQAVANYAAFPIFVSDEDVYPGHGNVDKVQTPKSTYTLFMTGSAPVIASVVSTEALAAAQTLTVTATDADGDLSGFYFGTSATATNNTFYSDTDGEHAFAVSAAGTYYLTALDAVGHKTTNTATYYMTTLSANGGTNSGAAQILSFAGISFTPAAPQRGGYRFLGWGISASATQYGTSIRPSQSATYYAIWEYVGFYGDANCDEVVTSADAAAILRYIVGLGTLSAEGLLRANVAGADDNVTAADATLILRYTVGLETKLTAAK